MFDCAITNRDGMILGTGVAILINYAKSIMSYITAALEYT